MRIILSTYEFLRCRLNMPRLRVRKTRPISERTHRRAARARQRNIDRAEQDMLDTEFEIVEVEEQEDYQKEENEEFKNLGIEEHIEEKESLLSEKRILGLELNDLKKQHKGRIEDLKQAKKHRSIRLEHFEEAFRLEQKKYNKSRQALLKQHRSFQNQQYHSRTTVHVSKPKMYDALQHRNVPLPSLFRVGKMEHTCLHCGALFWLNERLK